MDINEKIRSQERVIEKPELQIKYLVYQLIEERPKMKFKEVKRNKNLELYLFVNIIRKERRWIATFLSYFEIILNISEYCLAVLRSGVG